ncbi:MAG TPA: 23S rRNA (uracil(1939)-C(5))-methyltransferase RlmD [Planctomycetia bacterium]|nr:23S rRNA (uracil(1939)-C(5))-methyltransferase RlmD [Planctomycetia bacterium]
MGDEIELEIEEFGPTGDAIGRLDGYVVFVRDAIPGERLRVRISSAKPKFGRGETLERFESSPRRVTPRCRHFGECGRCVFQHLEYEDQLRLKADSLERLLRHELPGVSLPLRPMRGMSDPWGMRTKAHFVFTVKDGRPALGHFRPHSSEALPVVECPVHHPLANAAALATAEAVARHGIPVYREDSHKGSARHVVVRVGAATGQALVTLVTANSRIDHIDRFGPRIIHAAPGTTGVYRSLNPHPGPVVIVGAAEKLAGADRLIEKVAGIEYHLSPLTFFQTGAQGAEILVETVLEFAPAEAKTVLDLYCGAGLFSLPLARRGARVLGVEINAGAVEDAKTSAAANKIAGCEFLACPAERLFDRLQDVPRPEVVVLDPPREGCPESVLGRVAGDLRPKTIVSVSCEPTALARELAFLTRCGYEIRAIQPVDMFPHTAQIETVVHLERIERPGPLKQSILQKKSEPGREGRKRR